MAWLAVKFQVNSWRPAVMVVRVQRLLVCSSSSANGVSPALAMRPEECFITMPKAAFRVDVTRLAGYSGRLRSSSR